MEKRNPVAKHGWKFNKCVAFRQKKGGAYNRKIKHKGRRDDRGGSSLLWCAHGS